MIDLLGAIEITAGAGAVIAVIALISIEPGGTPARRLSIAVVLSLWFTVLVGLAAAGLFDRYVPAGLAATIGSFVVSGGGLFLFPDLRAPLAAIPLSTLIAIHVVRFFGLNFLVLYALGRLPAAPFGPFCKGRDALKAIGRVARDHQAALCAALTDDERTQLAQLLRRIADHQGIRPGVHPGFSRLRPS